MHENKVLNFSLLPRQVIRNFVHYVLLSMFITSNNLSIHFHMPSLPVHFRRRNKKDSPTGDSVWNCSGVSQVLGVSRIFEHIQRMESNAVLENLETRKLE